MRGRGVALLVRQPSRCSRSRLRRARTHLAVQAADERVVLRRPLHDDAFAHWRRAPSTMTASATRTPATTASTCCPTVSDQTERRRRRSPSTRRIDRRRPGVALHAARAACSCPSTASSPAGHRSRRGERSISRHRRSSTRRARRLARLPEGLQRRSSRRAVRPIAGGDRSATARPSGDRSKAQVPGAADLRPAHGGQRARPPGGRTSAATSSTSRPAAQPTDRARRSAFSTFASRRPPTAIFGRTTQPGDEVPVHRPGRLGRGVGAATPIFRCTRSRPGRPWGRESADRHVLEPGVSTTWIVGPELLRQHAARTPAAPTSCW